VLAGKSSSEKWSEDKIITYLRDRKKTGIYSPTDLAKSLAKESGWSRRDIYDLIQRLDNGSRS
jgi:hypothetical protein